MERLLRGKTIINVVLGIFLIFGAVLPSYAKAAKTRKAVSPLNIQGFRIGMTLSDAKKLLQKKKVAGYETGFSDLFVYSPSPGAEIKLLFTCSAKEHVLGRVELSTAFTVDETETALPKFKEKLVSRYGMPSITDSQWDRLDFCWGQCEQGASGTKLEAKTTVPQGNKRTLVLTLGDDALVRACSQLRPEKINSWLYQWIAAVQKFRPGMSFKDASLFYQKRYQDKMMTDEERDAASQQYAVTSYVVKDYDFFAALDFESQAFEGAGPGAIVLKFTGDQAGKGSLNRRLYYASFTTTKFTDKHIYADVKQKLDKFIKSYGKPAEIVTLPDGLTARWQQDAKQWSVTIFDSGLITFEQSDPALKDAYRDAAVKKIDEYNKTRFDRPIF